MQDESSDCDQSDRHSLTINGYNNDDDLCNVISKQLSIKSTASSSSSKATTVTNNGSPSSFIRPKLITILRNGSKPRKTIRLLLNKKTVHSFEQVLGDISTKFESGTVIRKLFTQRGKQVLCLQDLFNDEDIFIAYGLEKFCNDDLNLDAEETKSVYINKTSSLNRHTPKRTPNAKRVSSPLNTKNVSSPAAASSPYCNGHHHQITTPTSNGAKYSNNCINSNSPKQQRTTAARVLFAPTTTATDTILKSSTKNNLSNNRNQINYLKNGKTRKNEVKKYGNNGAAATTTATVTATAATNDNHLQYSPSTTTCNSISMILFEKEVIQKYEIGRIIGDGNFAVVHECIQKSNRKKFALKIIDKTKCKGKEAMIANEVSILRKIKHSNIIELIEDFDYHNQLYLVCELVTGGDLFDAIEKASKYDEYDSSRMIYNLSSALAYLHSLNICHRDIKPENLLVSHHFNGTKSLKLGDFGLAVQIKDGELLYTVCGTPTYVAPEILAETGYSLKVDVWAAGVIAYILLCGFPPFISQDNDQDELFDQILRGNFEFTSPYWDHNSNLAKQLITNMLQVDPDKRYSAVQVVQHPWVHCKQEETTKINSSLLQNDSTRKRNNSSKQQNADVSLITHKKASVVDCRLPLSAANFIFQEYANTGNQMNNGYDCGLPFELQQPQAFEDVAF